LKGDEWVQAEGKMNGAPDAEWIERFGHGPLDDASGISIERIRRAVRGLGGAGETIEERGSTRADDERARRSGKKLFGHDAGRGFVEARGRQRQEDVQAEPAQRGLERGEGVSAQYRRRAPT
jgi:hypothetical protein